MSQSADGVVTRTRLARAVRVAHGPLGFLIARLFHTD